MGTELIWYMNLSNQFNYTHFTFIERHANNNDDKKINNSDNDNDKNKNNNNDNK